MNLKSRFYRDFFGLQKKSPGSIGARAGECVMQMRDYLIVIRSTVFTPSPSIDRMYIPFALLLRSII